MNWIPAMNRKELSTSSRRIETGFVLTQSTLLFRFIFSVSCLPTKTVMSALCTAQADSLTYFRHVQLSTDGKCLNRIIQADSRTYFRHVQH